MSWNAANCRPIARLLVVVFLAGEDEVIVGDRGLARQDRVAAGDLVEGVDRERRGAVGRRQQVGVDAQRRARCHVGVLVDAMRPHDLRGRRHRARELRVREDHLGLALDRRAELAAADGEDAAALPNLVFLGAQRHRRVGLALRDVDDLPRDGFERELVAILRVGHGLGTLHHVQAEVERVAAEDVAHVVAADDHHLEADFFGDRLEAGRRHLARAADREAIAGDHERLAAMHAGAEVGHQVAERPRLPALVERLEALRHAVGGRRDLVGIDGVELLAGSLGIPDDQGLAADDPVGIAAGQVGRTRGGQGLEGDARLQDGGFRDLHNLSIVACRKWRPALAGLNAGCATPPLP